MIHQLPTVRDPLAPIIAGGNAVALQWVPLDASKPAYVETVSCLLQPPQASGYLDLVTYVGRPGGNSPIPQFLDLLDVLPVLKEGDAVPTTVQIARVFRPTTPYYLNPGEVLIVGITASGGTPFFQNATGIGYGNVTSRQGFPKAAAAHGSTDLAQLTGGR